MSLEDRVRTLLDEAGIAHALIGAAALAASGVVRSTLDIDVLTTDLRVLEEPVWQGLRDRGLEVEVRRGDDTDPLAGVVRIAGTGERPVDIIVGRFAWQQRAVRRATRLPSGSRVVQARDLVLLKLFAGGLQDLWDLRQLLNAVSDESLVRDVEADLADLPPSCRDAWNEVRRAS